MERMPKSKNSKAEHNNDFLSNAEIIVDRKTALKILFDTIKYGRVVIRL